MSGSRTAPALRWAGPRAFLVECADLPAVMALHAHLRAHPFPGQREAVAAAATVLVAFRTRDEALAAARTVTSIAPDAPDLAAARTVTVDVRYDGEDLDDVAALAGMSVEAVIAAHSEAAWVGAFGGFAPGFTYCAADPAPFDVPRRASPRTAVPAGSVAVAGRFSAVYPRASPGGWRLLGRTDAVLWDLGRPEPALLRPGDRVRYRPVRELATLTTTAPDPASAPASEGSPTPAATSPEPASTPPEPAPTSADTPGLTVVAPGLQSLVQDLGRPGRGDLGVTASGAADRDAARQANRLVGNAPDEAVVEALLGGLALTARGTQVLALAGADARARISGPAGTRTAPVRRPFALLDGETLTLEEPEAGLRTYVGLRGGIEAPLVLGSRSTDVMSGLGPAPLAAGAGLPRRADPGRALVGEAEAALRVTPRAGAVTVLRVLLGPREDWFDAASLARLTAQEWEATSQADRIGVRLAAPAGGRTLARARDGELASEGVTAGALQVPPSGEPVLFLADHPVTGGYPVIAVVVPEDLGAAAQLPPGARVRLVPVPPADPAQEA